MKPAIIFRGKGNISTEERDKYDNDVDVYFQVNAWIDTEINMDQPHPAHGLADDPTEVFLVPSHNKDSMKHAGK